MVDGAFVSAGPGTEYEVSRGHEEMTPYVFFTCLVAATGGLIFGYEIGISVGVTSMDLFLSKFFPSAYHKMKEDITSTNQYCMLNSDKNLTLFRSSLYLAALVASFFASWVTRKFGRKISMLIGGVVFLAGTAINGAAMHVAMLIIGRLLIGVGVGFTIQSVPLYLSEMAPTNYRGLLNGFFQLMIVIGNSIASWINIYSGWGWRMSLASAVVPAAIFMISSLFIPDTPNSLIERHLDNSEKAQVILRHIRGTNDVEGEYNELLAASIQSNKIDHPWRNILNRRYRPQLVTAVLIPFFQQMTGISVIMFYTPVLFRTIGIEKNVSLKIYAAFTGINVMATICGMYMVNASRKCASLMGGIVMLISQICLGTGDQIEMVPLILAISMAFAFSWGLLGWLVPSEIFPLEIRSAGQSINVSVNMLFTFLIVQAFPNMFCHLKLGLFYYFAFWVLCMTAFICILLPEPLFYSIEEVFGLWKRHWFWGKFN